MKTLKINYHPYFLSEENIHRAVEHRTQNWNSKALLTAMLHSLKGKERENVVGSDKEPK